MSNREVSSPLPEPVPSLSLVANAAIRFSALAERLTLEDRTLVNHVGGRAENVGEHTFNLIVVAPEIAGILYPHLDRSKVEKYAKVHDILEAYCGDTDTHNYASVDFDAKAEREKQALEMLKKDFEAFPTFLSEVEEYEQQQIPEARFVKVMDKVMPLLTHVHDGGATLSTYTNYATLFKSKLSPRNDYLLQEYPEFKELVLLRQELTQYDASLID